MHLTGTLWGRVTVGISAAIAALLVAATMADHAEGHRSFKNILIAFHDYWYDVDGGGAPDQGERNDGEYYIRVWTDEPAARWAPRCTDRRHLKLRRDGVIVWANETNDQGWAVRPRPGEPLATFGPAYYGARAIAPRLVVRNTRRHKHGCAGDGATFYCDSHACTGDRATSSATRMAVPQTGLTSTR